MTNFERISQHVFLRPATLNATPNKASDPSAILLLGWFFASPEHLAKYTDVYKGLFPAAPVIVVLPPFSAFFASSSSLHSTLLPAFTTLSSLVPLLSPSTTLLTHTFSNGGALSLKVLEELSWKTNGSGLPIRGMIVDSAPNTEVGTRLANEIFKQKSWTSPGSVFVAGTYAGISALSGITGLPTPITTLSTYLLNSFPSTHHLFLYSDIDNLIRATEIETHIQRLRERGRDVRTVKFVGTSHVGHVVGVENKRKYWEAVEGFWEEVAMKSDWREKSKKGVVAKL